MDTQLSYKKFGDYKRNIVFLHGFCEDSRMWNEFIDEAGLNAISIDLPGYGGSTQFDVTSLKDMAEKVHNTIEKLRITDYIIAGHSMGGYVAMEYLARYEDKLKGLALIHSHPFADSEERKEQRRRSMEFVDKYGVEVYAKQFFPKLFSTEHRDNFAIHSLSLRATQLSQSTIMNSLQAMIDRKDHSDTYKNAEIPVMLVAGTQDSLVNLKSVTEISVEPKRSMIKIYDHVGHMSMFEKPNALRSDLRRFIEFCELQ